MKKIAFDSEEIIKIVADGAFATASIADGRLIPVLILDTSSRPDIEDLIKAHRDFSPGDAKSMWSQNIKGTEKVWLVISFERPSACRAILEFNIVKDGGTVDQIINSEALYLQSGKEGQRLSTTLGKEGVRILVEVPSSHFKPEWNERLYNTLVSEGRRKSLSKALAKEYASGVIEDWRQVTGLRMKGRKL